MADIQCHALPVTFARQRDLAVIFPILPLALRAKLQHAHKSSTVDLMFLLPACRTLAYFALVIVIFTATPPYAARRIFSSNSSTISLTVDQNSAVARVRKGRYASWSGVSGGLRATDETFAPAGDGFRTGGQDYLYNNKTSKDKAGRGSGRARGDSRWWSCLGC
jgi:hypothetical protein